MIGWENDRGAYYINKLQEQIDSLASEDESIETSIGTLSNLTTTEKNNIVGAVNEVNSSVGTTDAKIGTLTNLNTSDKTDIVSAVNSVIALLDGAKFINMGTLANGKTLTVTNTGASHIEMLLFSHGIEASVTFAGLITLSGSSSASTIATMATTGSGITATASGKSVKLKDTSANARVFGIVFAHADKVTYSVDDTPAG